MLPQDWMQSSTLYPGCLGELRVAVWNGSWIKAGRWVTATQVEFLGLSSGDAASLV